MDLDLTAIRARQAAAHQMVNDLDQGRREWLMSIPARPNYDPDLVIDASLQDVPALLGEIDRLRGEREAMRSELDRIRAAMPECEDIPEGWEHPADYIASMRYLVTDLQAECARYWSVVEAARKYKAVHDTGDAIDWWAARRALFAAVAALEDTNGA